MKTGKQTAIFDCKRFNQKLPKEQWQIVADTDNITCSITFARSELPDIFKINGKPDSFVTLYASKTEREDAARQNRETVADRAAVRFKIGQNCRWFDKFGKSCQRPANVNLDSKRFEVNIDFARKDKVPGNPLAPSGYWANAIMFREIDDCPFAGEEFEKDEEPTETEQPAQQAQPAQPAQIPANMQAVDDGDYLPF